MKVSFYDGAWEEYKYLLENDKKLLRRVNQLIEDISINGEKLGIGKPEPLKYEYSSYYSRRIDYKNRLVYKVENDTIKIISCRSRY